MGLLPPPALYEAGFTDLQLQMQENEFPEVMGGTEQDWRNKPISDENPEGGLVSMDPSHRGNGRGKEGEQGVTYIGDSMTR